MIDPANSRFTVQAFVSGMLAKLGHSPTFAIREYAGEASVGEQPSVSIRIEPTSLTLVDQVSEKDRREIERTTFDEVLDVRRYRQIAFRSTNATVTGNRATVEGALDLRGVTRRQTITAQVEIAGESFRARGRFALLQSDFGIRPVRVAGGALKLKDELECLFDIVARRKTEAVQAT